MDAPHRRWLKGWRKSLKATTQECFEQYLTRHEDSTPQNSNCKATYDPSRKLSKLDKPDTGGHCWRSRDVLINYVLPWTPLHGRAQARRLTRTYVQQLYADTGCSAKDQPEAIDDMELWRDRVRNIRGDSVTWWWWWFSPCHFLTWKNKNEYFFSFFWNIL